MKKLTIPRLYLFVIAIWILWASICFSQPCNFSSIYNTDVGDTVFCNYGDPIGAFNDPNPVDSLPNTFFLDWTRPDINHSFNTVMNGLPGAYIRRELLRPDGFYVPAFTVIPAFNDPRQPLDVRYTIDDCNWIEINWQRRPTNAIIRVCWGYKCKKYPILLNNDSRVNIGTCWDDARLYLDPTTFIQL